jgi:hypothetical protein
VHREKRADTTESEGSDEGVNECQKSGCRNIKTICETCGRTVSTATLPKAEGWISIDEEYPPDSKDVLFWNGTHLFAGHMQNVICEDEIISRVYWSYSYNDFHLVSPEYIPTHWKPIQESPMIDKSDFVMGCVRDGEGNQMLCKCGKPGNFIAGKESFKIRCCECGWA